MWRQASKECVAHPHLATSLALLKRTKSACPRRKEAVGGGMLSLISVTTRARTGGPPHSNLVMPSHMHDMQLGHAYAMGSSTYTSHALLFPLRILASSVTVQ